MGQLMSSPPLADQPAFFLLPGPAMTSVIEPASGGDHDPSPFLL